VETDEKTFNRELKMIKMQDAICTKFTGGYVGSTHLFKKGRKKVVLKKYKQTRKKEDILFELEYLGFLTENKFNVPKPLSKPFKIKNNYYVFFDYLAGRRKSKNRVSQKEFKQVIQTVSKMHKASRKFHPKHSKSERDLFTFWFDDIVKKKYYKKIDVNTANFLSHEITTLKEKILPKKTDFKQLLIHNDLWLGNMKFSQDKIVFLDFDDCCLGAKVSDLAVVLIDYIITKQGINTNKLKVALDIYKKSNTLTKKEENILFYLIRHRILVHCNFYLMKYNETSKIGFKNKFRENLKVLQNNSLAVKKQNIVKE